MMRPAPRPSLCGPAQLTSSGQEAAKSSNRRSAARSWLIGSSTMPSNTWRIGHRYPLRLTASDPGSRRVPRRAAGRRRSSPRRPPGCRRPNRSSRRASHSCRPAQHPAMPVSVLAPSVEASPCDPVARSNSPSRSPASARAGAPTRIDRDAFYAGKVDHHPAFAERFAGVVVASAALFLVRTSWTE